MGDFTISVNLEDEDGTFSDVATQAVSVSAPADTIDVAAQGNAVIDEGDTFTRTINFTDGEDNGAAGYTVDIDWDNDGDVDESFATICMVNGFPKFTTSGISMSVIFGNLTSSNSCHLPDSKGYPSESNALIDIVLDSF